MTLRFAQFIIFMSIIWLAVGCEDTETETERSKVVRLLTDNSRKGWGLTKSTRDGSILPLSTCDSAYVLYLYADFTWEEYYDIFNCNKWNSGTWSLNEANNVIQSQSYDPIRFDTLRSDLEILILNDTVLQYGFYSNERRREITLIAEKAF